MRAGITELVRCTISARPNGSISRQRFLPRHIRDLARHGGRAYMLQTDWQGAITHNMTLERRSANWLSAYMRQRRVVRDLCHLFSHLGQTGQF